MYGLSLCVASPDRFTVANFSVPRSPNVFFPSSPGACSQASAWQEGCDRDFVSSLTIFSLIIVVTVLFEKCVGVIRSR